MDYCFFAPPLQKPEKNQFLETSLDSLRLSLMWQVEADSSYHIVSTHDTPPDVLVAVRTIAGVGELLGINGRYTLTEGTLLILPVREVLEYYTKKPRWSFYWFEFTGYPLISQEVLMLPLSEVEYCLLGDLVSSLCSQSSVTVQAGFKYILGRWLAANGEDATDIALQVARYINASPCEASLSFESLLAHFKVSERTLRRRFQETFGTSPRRYILDRRLRLATVLLKTTDMLLKDIAEKTGFQNEYYFSTCFKKRHGISPSEYRSG